MLSRQFDRTVGRPAYFTIISKIFLPASAAKMAKLQKSSVYKVVSREAQTSLVWAQEVVEALISGNPPDVADSQGDFKSIQRLLSIRPLSSLVGSNVFVCHGLFVFSGEYSNDGLRHIRRPPLTSILEVSRWPR